MSMIILYDFFIRLYFLGVQIVSVWNPKAKKWIQGRKNIGLALRDYTNELSVKNKDSIWFHCASVGEFEQGLPLIQRFENEYPQHQIVLTFFSPSGYEYARKNYSQYNIFYLPLDTKSNATFWLEELQPKAIFFIKYEFWHHYFHQAHAGNTPLYVVSAIFWKELFFFKWYGGFFRKSLEKVSHFFVQDDTSKKLLNDFNIHQVSKTGDTRFERVLKLKNESFNDEIIEAHKNNQKLFIAGSVWDRDIPIIKRIMASLPDDYQVLIAPHEINSFSYEKFSDISYQKYDNYKNQLTKILFLNTIGTLSKSYKYADISYVGGGFGKGIHNVLEPAVHNIPILIGPNHKRFREAQELQQHGLLFVISKEETTTKVVLNALDVGEEHKASNNSFFTANTNVSEQIIVFIKKQGILD